MEKNKWFPLNAIAIAQRVQIDWMVVYPYKPWWQYHLCQICILSLEMVFLSSFDRWYSARPYLSCLMIRQIDNKIRIPFHECAMRNYTAKPKIVTVEKKARQWNNGFGYEICCVVVVVVIAERKIKRNRWSMGNTTIHENVSIVNCADKITNHGMKKLDSN